MVCDEEGELRGFPSKAEALQFIGDRLEEFSIKIKPRRRKPDPFELVGEAPF